jgi:very-short-patch-repair endonuclease
LKEKKFSRQHIICNYIADFCCLSGKLIIELDRDPHGGYHKIEKDEIRDSYLVNLGFPVLRFENRFLFRDPEYLKSEKRNGLN